jgi:hypothetical protein
MHYNYWIAEYCQKGSLKLRRSIMIIIITDPQKQGLVESVGPIFEVCENDCIRYIATLSDKEGFFVPEVAMETETKKKQ